MDTNNATVSNNISSTDRLYEMQSVVASEENAIGKLIVDGKSETADCHTETYRSTLFENPVHESPVRQISALEEYSRVSDENKDRSFALDHPQCPLLTMNNSSAGEHGSEKSLVRRKTAAYLQRAEKLITRFSLRDKKGQEKAAGTVNAPVSHRRPASIKDPYLENYKVLGLCGRLMLATDTVTQDLVVIKKIEKSEEGFRSEKSFPPCHIPFMVPLIRYHEGDSAIYLVIKYVSGGNLWDHTKKYSRLSPCSVLQLYSNTCSSRYAGQNLISRENEASSSILSSTVMQITAQEVQSAQPSDAVLQSLTSRMLEEDISYTDFGSMNLNLALLECRSTTENLTPSSPLDKYRVISSLSSLVPLPVDSPCCTYQNSRLAKFDIGNIEYSYCFKSGVKSKSLDDLEIKNENFQIKKTDASVAFSLKSLKSFELDGFSSIGSDTLSGVSDEFGSALILAQELEFSNAQYSDRLEKHSNICAEQPSKCEKIDSDVSSLIMNSKKLLKNVNRTLERSKKQIFLQMSAQRKDESDTLERDLIVNSEPKTILCENISCCVPLPPENTQLTLSSLFDKYYVNNQSQGEDIVIPEGLVRVWVSQVVTALEALHNQGLIWGDFNPCNILLDEGGGILVTYFCDWVMDKQKKYYGTAWWHTSRSFNSHWSMMYGYIAPELISPLSLATFASDWWSVGALLFHLLSGQDVASAHPCGITSHTQINISPHVSDEAASLIRNLLCAHPSERLGGSSSGAQEIKAHPFFFGIQWPS